MVDMKANLFGDRGEFDAVHEIVELLSPNDSTIVISIMITITITITIYI